MNCATTNAFLRFRCKRRYELRDYEKYSGVRGAMNCATTNAMNCATTNARRGYSGVRGAMNCATTNERGAAPKCKRRYELRDYERKRRGSSVRGAMNCATTNAFLKGVRGAVRGAMNCATTNAFLVQKYSKRRYELRDYERKRRGSQV